MILCLGACRGTGGSKELIGPDLCGQSAGRLLGDVGVRDASVRHVGLRL